MSNDDQRTLAANLLLERVELKRDIAKIKSELVARAETVIKFGNLLRANPHAVCIDDQHMSGDYAQRAQKFSTEEMNHQQIAALVDELRTKSDRLTAAEQQIRAMGYSPD